VAGAGRRRRLPAGGALEDVAFSLKTMKAPSSCRAALAALAAWAPFTAAAQEFFAPPQTAGSLVVALHPTEVVVPGQSTLVTFGVPFPRGSITVAGLSTVRVLKDGAEIAAYVDQATPWRHATNPAVNGASVRVARIQFRYTFAVSFPQTDTVTVAWGGPPRTQTLPTLQNPRDEWHRVTDGTTSTGGPTFAASHDVWEPDVYAVLPVSWLVNSGIKTRMASMDPAVGPNRLNPASMPASLPGYREADHAQVNFFYTLLNQDDPLTGAQNSSNTNFFLGGFSEQGEPWLYDRAMAMYTGYFRSGFFRFLREAVRNSEFYRDRLYEPSDCDNGSCVGGFSLKTPSPSGGQDAKYSYNEPLATTYWLTGDPTGLPQIEHVVRPHQGTPTRQPASTGALFTERHMGLKLMAYVVAYEVTGLASYRDTMLSILADFRALQTTPFGGGSVDGGMWHRISNHEGVGETDPITSPWMSTLVADAVARAYLVSESATAADVLKGLASHECGVGSYMTTIRDGENGLADQSGGAPLRFPHYLATRDGLGWDDNFDPFSDFEHAYDVAAVVAWGAYFEGRAGNAARQAQLKTCTNEFYTTFSHVITFWTRPGAPASNADAYRASPHRKYSWWFKNASGFGWAIAQGSGTPPTPPTVSLTSPANGAQFTAPATINLAATAAATTSGASITRVEFFQGATRLGEDTTAPYTFSWTGVGAGVYTLTARATDSLNGTATSAAVSVSVTGAGCSVSAVGNIFNRTFPPQSGTFTVMVDATPLPLNGVLQDTGIGVNQNPTVGQTSPFQTAATVRFNTENGRIEARTGFTYTAATAVPWTAGQTYRLRLVVNVPSHTYAAYVTPPGAAEQVIGTGLAFRSNYAAATMLNNLSGPVDAGSIRLCNIVVPEATPDVIPPTVSLTSPTGGTASGSITLSANASDNVGVAGVSFLVDGSGVGPEDTTSPYSLPFDTRTLADGSHTVAARARDAAGNSATSAPVTVSVTNCGLSTAGSIFNRTFPAQSGSFTVMVDATPLPVNGVLQDTGVGVNQNPPVGQTNSFQTAATVRFNTSNGRIEARTGFSYTAATAVSWTAGQTYRLRLVVNVPSHTYAAYVTPPGGPEHVIGTGLAFRSNYASATMLNNMNGAVDAGSIRLCNLVVPSQ
jgi:hypothetical protein